MGSTESQGNMRFDWPKCHSFKYFSQSYLGREFVGEIGVWFMLIVESG